VIDPAATSHPLSVWDDGSHSFVVQPGKYTVYVGNSSEHTPLTAVVEI
jgi:beta-glucosidase